MKELVETLAAWRAEELEVGRAVVVRTFGSAPRPEGAVLLLASDGRIAGSVSGGCVEGAAADQIRRARSDGRSRVIRYGISDEQAWDVGLACGGTIDVLVEPLVRREVEVAARMAAGLADADSGPGADDPAGAAGASAENAAAGRAGAGEPGRPISRSPRRDRRSARTRPARASLPHRCSWHGRTAGSTGPSVIRRLTRRSGGTRPTRSCVAPHGRSRSAGDRSSSRRSRGARGS